MGNLWDIYGKSMETQQSSSDYSNIVQLVENPSCFIMFYQVTTNENQENDGFHE